MRANGIHHEDTKPRDCHCEEQSDEAIPIGRTKPEGDCFAPLAMTDPSLLRVFVVNFVGRYAAGFSAHCLIASLVNIEFQRQRISIGMIAIAWSPRTPSSVSILPAM